VTLNTTGSKLKKIQPDNSEFMEKQFNDIIIIGKKAKNAEISVENYLSKLQEWTADVLNINDNLKKMGD